MSTLTNKISSNIASDTVHLWERMTIDEYAELENKMGAKLQKRGGIWWRQVRPCFYRPLFPFAELSPNEIKGLFGRWTVIQHPVSSTQPHNSYINFLAFEQPQSYLQDGLHSSFRRRIRKASRYVTVRLIRNADVLIDEGFQVYLSFYERTGYSFRNDRVKKKEFTNWVKLLYSFPKVAVWGSYAKNQLVGVWTNCMVEDVLLLVSAFDSVEGIKLRSPELMLHTIRMTAGERSNIRRIYTGMLSSKQSLNNFKIERGASVLALPAYLHLHPMLLSLIGFVRKDLHKRLKGMNERQIEHMIKGIRFGSK